MEEITVNEELLFAEKVNEVMPILETLKGLLEGGRIKLKNQQFRMEANHNIIVQQEKQIADNKNLMKDFEKQGEAIIKAAQDKAAIVERGIQERIAETNHLNREAKKILEEAQRKAFSKKEKVTA